MTKSKPITLEDLKKEVKRLDPKLKETDASFATALILLSSIVVGANQKKIKAFTGLPAKLISEKSKPLRENKIWVGSDVNCNDWFDELGSIAFWCDVLVADGMGYKFPDKIRG